MIAEKLRAFIDALFPNRLALSLRRELDAERERFRELDKRGGIVFETVSAMYRDRIEDLKRRTEVEFSNHAGEIVILKAEIEEARKERDYFRGRAERLELRLIPEAPRREPRDPNIAGTTVNRRKNWRDVQADHAEKLRLEEEAERKTAEEKKGRPDAPKPLDVAATGIELRPQPEKVDAGASASGREKSI